jgi:hypothetical protein
VVEDHFATHPPRAAPELREPPSCQIGFLTADYIAVRP